MVHVLMVMCAFWECVLAMADERGSVLGHLWEQGGLDELRNWKLWLTRARRQKWLPIARSRSLQGTHHPPISSSNYWGSCSWIRRHWCAWSLAWSPRPDRSDCPRREWWDPRCLLWRKSPILMCTHCSRRGNAQIYICNKTPQNTRLLLL